MSTSMIELARISTGIFKENSDQGIQMSSRKCRIADAYESYSLPRHIMLHLQIRFLITITQSSLIKLSNNWLLN